jgi:hypothetical protein
VKTRHRICAALVVGFSFLTASCASTSTPDLELLNQQAFGSEYRLAVRVVHWDHWLDRGPNARIKWPGGGLGDEDRRTLGQVAVQKIKSELSVDAYYLDTVNPTWNNIMPQISEKLGQEGAFDGVLWLQLWTQTEISDDFKEFGLVSAYHSVYLIRWYMYDSNGNWIWSRVTNDDIYYSRSDTAAIDSIAYQMSLIPQDESIGEEISAAVQELGRAQLGSVSGQ